MECAQTQTMEECNIGTACAMKGFAATPDAKQRTGILAELHEGEFGSQRQWVTLRLVTRHECEVDCSLVFDRSVPFARPVY